MQHVHNHHPNTAQTSSYRALILSVALLFIFALIEALGGWWANSLTLLSDAGHMLADGLSLLLAAIAGWIASKPASLKHSYGLGRAEVLGAWLSSLFMVVIALFLGIEAIHRLQSSQTVSGGIVIFIAGIGLTVNLILTYILHRSEQTLNTRAAILHLMGDLLGSIAALISGAVIYFTGWAYIDPILSLFVAILILISSFKLLRETLLVLMEGVPLHLDLNEIKQSMCSLENILDVHDLHIWTLSSGVVVLTAYVEISALDQWTSTLAQLNTLLQKKFQITHITLQPQIGPQSCML